MKHLPRIYPIAFALLLAVLLFAGVWSVAETAVNGRAAIPKSSVAAAFGERAEDFEWYEHAAIFVCPLH